MHITWLLAWRYLRASGQTTISWMATICCVGIFIGTFSLTLIISIMRGFEKVTHEKLQGMHAHIVGNARGQSLDMQQIEPILAREFPAEIRTSAFSLQQALVQEPDSDDVSNMVFVKGIDALQEERVSSLADKITTPRNTPLSELLTDRNVVIGTSLARTLHASVGDTIWLLVPADTQKATITFSKISAHISGLFFTGIDEFDSGLVICSHTFFDALWPDTGITHINFHVPPSVDQSHLLKQLHTRFEGISFYAWHDLYPALVAALKLEKWAMFFILLLISLVASMNMIALLFMYVTYKRSDLALLQSMGMRLSDIRLLFIKLGMIITLAAASSGLGAAIGVGLLLQRYPFISLPDAYCMTTLPIELDPWLFGLVFCSVMVMGMIATCIPLYAVRVSSIAHILRCEG